MPKRALNMHDTHLDEALCGPCETCHGPASWTNSLHSGFLIQQ